MDLESDVVSSTEISPHFKKHPLLFSSSIKTTGDLQTLFTLAEFLLNSEQEQNSSAFQDTVITAPSVSSTAIMDLPMTTPCQYFTLHTSSVNIHSPHYHYANQVENVFICSQPTLVASAPLDAPVFCPHATDFTECSKYQPAVQVLKVAEATSSSGASEQFHLLYSPEINLFENRHQHVFVIQNITHDNICGRLVIPHDDFVFDAAAHHADEVFTEYLTAYEHIITGDTPSVVPEIVLTSPYFEHVIALG